MTSLFLSKPWRLTLPTHGHVILSPQHRHTRPRFPQGKDETVLPCDYNLLWKEKPVRNLFSMSLTKQDTGKCWHSTQLAENRISTSDSLYLNSRHQYSYIVVGEIALLNHLKAVLGFKCSWNTQRHLNIETSITGYNEFLSIYTEYICGICTLCVYRYIRTLCVYRYIYTFYLYIYNNQYIIISLN